MEPEGPPSPKHGKEMERMPRAVFQNPYFWRCRHTNALTSCCYRYQGTVLLPSITSPRVSTMLSLNYQVSPAAAGTLTLQNSSTNLPITWRGVYEQVPQYCLSFGLGSGRQTVQIPLNGRS